MFIACGYSAANMDARGKDCGRLEEDALPSLPHQGGAVRRPIADRIDSFILALDEDRVAKLAPERALVRILTEYGRMALAEDTTAIQKLVLAKSDRFPALAADFYRGAAHRHPARVRARASSGSAMRARSRSRTSTKRRGHAPRHDRFSTLPAARCSAKRRCQASSDIENRAARCARLFLDGCRKDEGAVVRPSANHRARGRRNVPDPSPASAIQPPNP